MRNGGEMKKNKDPVEQEVVENMINNLNLPNMEMDSVEKMILSIFKNSNSERGFQNFDFDEFNMKAESLQIAKKEGEKGKDKIFSFVKIPKEKKKEIEMMKQNNLQFTNQNTFNFNNNIQNMNFYNNYQYKPNTYNYINSYYPYYMNGFDQSYSNNQIDAFINTCLDSNNPDDLTKLLMFFSENKNYINSNNAYQYYYAQNANSNKEKEMYNTLKRYVSESYSTANTSSNNNENDSAKAQNENSPNEKTKNEIPKEKENYIVNMISDSTPNKEFVYPQQNIYNSQYYNYANYANPLYTQYMLNQYSTQLSNVNTI